MGRAVVLGQGKWGATGWGRGLGGRTSSILGMGWRCRGGTGALGTWLGQVQYPPGGDRQEPEDPQCPRLGADLQGSEKLAAALDARNVKKQVDGP